MQTGLVQLTDEAQMRRGNVTRLSREQKASKQTDEPFFLLTLQRFKHFAWFFPGHSVAAARRLSWGMWDIPNVQNMETLSNFAIQ